MTDTPTTDERLLHLPMTDDSTAVTGIHWCVICDTEWPCDIREGRGEAEA